ncbi:MAG: hypothetical protein RSD96_03415 [Bacilli bacterium]
MKKIILLFTFLVLSTGCMKKEIPTAEVKKFIDRYQMLDSAVVDDLNTSAKAEGLSTENTTLYVDAVKREYKHIKYKVLSEDITKDTAVVKVKLSVYDLYKAKEDASIYLKEHTEEFQKDGVYNEDMFLKYQLDKMKKTEKMIDYTAEFNLTKIDNKWIVNELDGVTKEKLHGLYNYEKTNK